MCKNEKEKKEKSMNRIDHVQKNRNEFIVSLYKYVYVFI